MSEQDIVNAILDYLTLIGAQPIRINSGMRVIQDEDGKRRVFRGAKKGTSDILACLPGGRFAAIEVKVPGKKASKDQAKYLAEIKDTGGLAILAYSVDDVKNAIDNSTYL